MSIFILLVICFLVIFLVKKVVKTEDLNNFTEKEIYPYRPISKGFMSQAEKDFFKQLEITNQDKFYIVPQVPLKRILEVDWSKTKEHKKYFSKIDKKIIDYVLFTKNDFKFHHAIELNDYTHDSYKVKKRDIFVNRAMEAAGLKLETVDDRQSFKTL